MELDPDIAAMKRANRRPLWIGLGVVAGAVVVAGLWVARGAGEVRAALEADGHSEVEVKVKGPFEFGYQSKKGAMVCGGSVTRFPFSSSQDGTCFGTEAEPKPKPSRPEGEILAEKLRTQFPELPALGARCAKIDPGATKVTCALESDAGAPLDLELEKTGSEWKIKSPQRILSRATFATTLTDELQQKAKAPVTVDCGAGLFGYSDGGELICSARKKSAKKDGSMTVKFAGEGYTWTATGI